MLRLRLVPCVVLCLCFLFAGCEKKSNTPAELAFPGLEWGMTKEEVIAAFSLEEGDYEIEETSQGDSFFMSIEDSPICFGAPTQGMLLSFSSPDPSTEAYHLLVIQVLYPEGTNMQLVRRAMESYYGSPKDENTPETRWDEDSNGHVAHWATDETLNDVLTDEIKQKYFVMDGDPMNPEPGKRSNYFLKRPLREIYWSDDRNEFQGWDNLMPVQGYLYFAGGYEVIADYWLSEEAKGDAK